MKKSIISDMLAGLSVSFAALALGAAFGIMSGRGAFAGMIASGVIPVISGIFGGTRLNISGPTAPMTAVSAIVIALAYDNFQGNPQHAEKFITLVFLLTALTQITMGVARAGKLINLVPNVIVIGFMNGIALLIWIDQIKTMFGIGNKVSPQGNLVVNISIALATFTFIFLFPLLLKKIRVPEKIIGFIPATLTAIILFTAFTSATGLEVGRVSLGLSITSLGEFFEMVIAYLPSREIITREYLLMALPYALELALLGYLDSLLTALIMDKLTGEKSNLNRELIGQGLANGTAAVLLGIPGAQATIRSVLLFKEGAKTRFASVMAGIFTLLGFIVFRDYVSLITKAVFIGVLLKVALDVFERDFVISYFREKWFGSFSRNAQFAFITYTMLVTAFVDLNVAVISGSALFYIGKKFYTYEDV